MEKQNKYQEVISEIKEVYAGYALNPDLVISRKEELIEKIKSLPMPWDRKECLGVMLLTCLDALFSNAKSNLPKSERSALKIKTMDEVQEILKIYPEITLDKEGSFNSRKVQNF